MKRRPHSQRAGRDHRRMQMNCRMPPRAYRICPSLFTGSPPRPDAYRYGAVSPNRLLAKLIYLIAISRIYATAVEGAAPLPSLINLRQLILPAMVKYSENDDTQFFEMFLLHDLSRFFVFTPLAYH